MKQFSCSFALEYPRERNCSFIFTNIKTNYAKLASTAPGRKILNWNQFKKYIRKIYTEKRIFEASIHAYINSSNND